MSTPQPQGSVNDQSYRAILDYLNRRGHTRAAAALTADLAPDAATSSAATGNAAPNAGGTGSAPGTPGASPAASGGGKAVGLEDFADRNAPSQPRTPAAGAGAAPRRRPDQAVASGQMLADPPSWEKGYEGLRNFVDNSLDIHRPELHPLLLPLFVHAYLDLVLVGYREAADNFLSRFTSDHQAANPHIVRMLAAIRNASHVSESEDATRWRQERYHVRLSERGWGLLLGWLQGGGLAGSIEGTEARGRDRVLAIINERVKVDAIPGPPAKIPTDYGLASEMLSGRGPQALEQLKLGPAPIDPKLQREIARQVKEDEGAVSAAATRSAAAPAAATEADGSAVSTPGAIGTDGKASVAEGDSNDIVMKSDTTPTAVDFAESEPKETALPELVSPFPAELPPYPTTLRTIDVMREVEKVREARKRIRLGAEAYAPGAVESQIIRTDGRPVHGQGTGTQAAKPSVCLFTVHDSGDSLTTTTFSEDSTLMAAGFSESYIRIWSLKGAKLPAMRTDFDSDHVITAEDLKTLREADGPTSRKLVGHSGPVYALSFDPVPGPSGPPRYLLSASADATVRLWSLETWSNLVAYRGHREPVWDVEWGPRGIYFATASRDRTARLWTTDKTSALRIFAGHLSDVNCVRFHPNSLYLATGSSDRTCRLWDVQKGVCVRVFVGHRGPVTCIAISPDGRWLASGSEDLSIILWDLAAGRQVKAFTGHTSAVYSLSFSAESTVLVSGSADSTVRVWDVLTHAADSNAQDESGGAGLNGGSKLTSVAGARRAAALAGLAKSNKAVNGVDSVEGGRVVKFGGALGASGKSGDQERQESSDLLATLATKRTPVLEVKFTPRNLCMAAGPMQDG